MKPDPSEFEHHILSYASLIMRFENQLKKIYNLQTYPREALKKFPVSGVILFENKNAQYHFHGGGCSVRFDDVELHYDVEIANPLYYILISPWKFAKFINTFLRLDTAEFYSTEEVANELENAGNKGLLHKRHAHLMEYGIYTSWIKNCMVKS